MIPVLLVALCNPAAGEVMQDITDSNIRSYINSQLELNPPEMNAVSGVLTREAKAALRDGKTEEAIPMLEAAGIFSSSNPEPALILARVELMRGNPEFLLHFIEAVKRGTSSFYRSALFSVNMYILFISSAGIALLLFLLALAVKYNGEIFHKPEEILSRKFKLPRTEYLGLAVLAALLLLRPGFAVYIVLLSALVWRVVSSREKTALVSVIILLAAGSFFIQRTDSSGPILDEHSVTRKLSLINEQGATDRLIGLIRGIDQPEFLAEKNFALGTLMYRRGRLISAREHLKRSITEKNNFIPSYINLGNVYFQQEDFDKALAGYRNALTFDSTSAIAHYNIGQACIKKMHFNLSSSALKKARRFGIEEYKTGNPMVAIRNPEVLTCGFRKSDLKDIAARESRIESFRLFDRIFRGYVFVPFGWLWFLLPAGILAGIALNRLLPDEWEIIHCDNCLQTVCPDCVDTSRGLTLCSECTSVVEGLSSVKVMEALLRRRRQKKISDVISGKWRAMGIVPGGTYILKDKRISALMIMMLCSVSFNLLIRNGLYFKDPRFMFTPDSLWRIIVPSVVIGFFYIISLRSSRPEGPRRYCVLPQELQDVPEEAQESAPLRPAEEKTEESINVTGGQVEDPFGTFIDSI